MNWSNRDCQRLAGKASRWSGVGDGTCACVAYIHMCACASTRYMHGLVLVHAGKHVWQAAVRDTCCLGNRHAAIYCCVPFRLVFRLDTAVIRKEVGPGSCECVGLLANKRRRPVGLGVGLSFFCAR